MGRGSSCLVAVGLAGILAAGCGGDDDLIIDEVRISVDPAVVNVRPGETDRFRAVAELTDGTVVVRDDATWASEDETIATIDAEGVVTGQAPGLTHAVASVVQAGGGVATASGEVIVLSAEADAAP